MTRIWAYTLPVQTARGRYRLRTWLRGNAPRPVCWAFVKGKRDCGQHEWYRQDDHSDACYHCVVGRRAHQPIDVPIDVDLRRGLAAAAARGRASAATALDQIEADDRKLGHSSPAVR